MNNRTFYQNYHSRSELIREIYGNNPLATNRNIIEACKKAWGITVKSNLITNAIGTEKARRANLKPERKNKIKRLVKELLTEAGDKHQAIHYLRAAM